MRKSLFWFLTLALSTVSPALGQTFNSGSTGADGALEVNESCSEVLLPPSGVLNYTTVNVHAGTCLVFTPNLQNTPVVMLAQGDVTIAGNVFLNGSGRVPGPGGFFGGDFSTAGFGPGGGQFPRGSGTWVGPLSLVPIVGGSGAAGGTNCCFGGGGGGAIVIASSASIRVSGEIHADGFIPVDNAGSGGAIRLVGNSIAVSGILSAAGPFSNHGVIRLEAPSSQLSFTGSTTPAAVISPINPQILSSDPTTAALTIASVGGFQVLSYSGSRPGVADVLLPRQLTDPISVVVQARNIPVGTQVNMNLSGSTGATFTPGTLAGTAQASMATLTVSGLDRNALTHLFVNATFDVPPSTAGLNPKGPDQVARVRVETSAGGKPTFAFMRADGTQIDQAKVSKELLEYFGK